MNKRVLAVLLSLALIACTLALGAVANATQESQVNGDLFAGTRTCAQCGQEVQWTALDGTAIPAENGHYYLTGPVALPEQITLPSGDYSIALDLNGYTITGASRAFQVESGVSLSILDAVGTGKIEAAGVADGNGGVFLVDKGATLNIHGGTFTNTETTNGIDTAGVAYISGTLNILGGQIVDGQADRAADNVYVAATAQMTMSGGTVTGGVDCDIYHRGTAHFSGNAQVTKLRLSPRTSVGGPALADMMTITGQFDGKLGIILIDSSQADGQADLDALVAGVDIGNGENAVLNNNNVYLRGNSALGVKVQPVYDEEGNKTGEELVLAERTQCEHCNETVVWYALDETCQDAEILNRGHYYLAPAGDVLAMAEKQIPAGHKVCLDLKGKQIAGANRAFDLQQGAELTVLGEGQISGCGTEDNGEGGVILVGQDATLNLYAATLQSRLGENAQLGASNGGVVAVNGTFNMLGGAVNGETAYTGENTNTAATGKGSAVYVSMLGKMAMSGGAVTGNGDCLYTEGTLELSGTASADNVTLAPVDGGTSLGDLLNLAENYTGTAVLTVAELTVGTDIGNSDLADLSAANLSLGGTTLGIGQKGTDLFAAELKYCAHCKETLPFLPLGEDWAAETTLSGGHYYLAFQEDSLEIAEKTVTGGVCLDLRGKTLAGQTRAFYLPSNSSLAILGEGTVTGSGLTAPDAVGSRTYGGAILVDKDATLDLYEATVSFAEREGQQISVGGVIASFGTVNMHGGTLPGGTASYAAGTFYLGGSGTLNMTGGAMYTGTATEGGDCAFIRGAVYLSGDAYIQEMRLLEDDQDLGGPTLSEMLTITGPYSQEIVIYPTPAVAGTDIGTSVNADLTGARITVKDNKKLLVGVSGTDLILIEGELCPYCNQRVLWKDVDETFADITTLTTGHYRMVFTGDSLEISNMTVPAGQKVCLDLNGKSLTSDTRAFTLESGASLAIIGEGTVTGSYMPGNTQNGGTIYAAQDSTLALLAATLQVCSAEGQSVANGGVVYTDGVLDMRGGQILGGYAENAGGAVYLSATGTLNMTGGSITGGTSGQGGACTYAQGKLNLSKAATVESVRLLPGDGVQLGDMLTISGEYTGALHVETTEAAFGMDVGNSIGAELAENQVTLTKIDTTEPVYTVVPYNTDLVIAEIRWCDHCKKDVSWTPLTEINAEASRLKTGHYYLAFEGEHCEITTKTIPANATVCLDLNGKSITSNKRSFLVNSGATFTILGEGTVTGRGTPANSEGKYEFGGTIYVAGDATVNLYEATLTFADSYPDQGAENGGVVAVYGTFNMFGGQIVGGHANYAGGSVYVGYSPSGVFNMSGGSIYGGYSNASSFCMVNRGRITLSGDASIEDLHLLPRGDEGTVPLSEMLTIQGDYTGTVCLRINGPKAGMDIGTSDSANLANANISIYRRTLKVVVKETDLVLTAEAFCPHCQAEFVWQPVTASYADDGALAGGHYYLAFDEESYVFEPMTIASGNMVCLDLGGKNLTGSARAFTVEDGAILNLMGEGTLAGRGTTDNGNGGTLLVEENGELNLYNVILTYDDSIQEQGVTNGGVIAAAGAVNMYDGQISGGTAANGANLYVGETGTFTMTAGQITAQEGQKEVVDGKVTLSGDASVSHLYLKDAADGLTISGAYTGDIALEYQDPTDGMDAGNSDDADLSGANITISNYTNADLYVQDPDLVLVSRKIAVIRNAQGVVKAYEWLASAVAEYTDETTWIEMIADTEETVEINKTVYLDLNGYDVSGTISGSGTLYVMDSQTDDFTVKDGNGYGTLSGTVTVDVQALPVESTLKEYGYLKINEDGKLSFHYLAMKIKSTTLRPEVAGIFFNSIFNGDEVIADRISYFGVALRAYEEPDETTLQNPLQFTAFGKELFGSSESLTSTILAGILKTENSFSTNLRNFKVPVYGRAYIVLEDGTVIFGAAGQRSLKEQLEGIDKKWDTLEDAQVDGLVEMYNTFKIFLKYADMPNLDAYIRQLNAPAVPPEDPETTDPEPTDPEDTDSENTDSENTDSENTDSENTDSENTDPENADPVE